MKTEITGAKKDANPSFNSSSNSGAKKQIEHFYDAISPLWKDLWGIHVHHGYLRPSDDAGACDEYKGGVPAVRSAPWVYRDSHRGHQREGSEKLGLGNGDRLQAEGVESGSAAGENAGGLPEGCRRDEEGIFHEML
jgi:hypothetical protein